LLRARPNQGLLQICLVLALDLGFFGKDFQLVQAQQRSRLFDGSDEVVGRVGKGEPLAE